MEFFLPSVLILLLAAATVFFVLPRFGPFVLTIVSIILLVLGVYQHMGTFGAEYRLSTWWMSLLAYAPYVLVGALLFFIAVYLLYLLPSRNTTAVSPVSLPTVSLMPSANTSTNPVTAAINKALNSAANVVSNNGSNKGIINTITNTLTGKNNNKGLMSFSRV